MLIEIDEASPTPLFQQVAGAVRRAVLTGEVEPGERLPAARDLAAGLEVNVNTVLHAYRVLREEGLIELRRGRGATISPTTAHDYAALRARLSDLLHESARLGVSRTTLTALLAEAVV